MSPKEKPYVMIATPMYGGMAGGLFTKSMLELQRLLADTDIKMTYAFAFNESLITRGRNDLVHTFMKSKCTHLMFIDADIGFNPMDVVKMIRTDTAIICGVYPKKRINWEAIQDSASKNDISIESLKRASGDVVVDLLVDDTNTSFKRSEPYPVRHAGTGFMLINRVVFTTLADKVPTYTNNGYVNNGELTKEYFATSIEVESNELLSEDYHFCKLWRDNGGIIYIAPWCNLQHMGTYVFEGRL